MVEIEIEVPVVLLVMLDIIPINLVVDMVVYMMYQVMMILQMFHAELAQVAPLLCLEEDIDMSDIPSSMANYTEYDSYEQFNNRSVALAA